MGHTPSVPPLTTSTTLSSSIMPLPKNKTKQTNKNKTTHNLNEHRYLAAWAYIFLWKKTLSSDQHDLKFSSGNLDGHPQKGPEFWCLSLRFSCPLGYSVPQEILKRAFIEEGSDKTEAPATTVVFACHGFMSQPQSFIGLCINYCHTLSCKLLAYANRLPRECGYKACLRVCCTIIKLHCFITGCYLFSFHLSSKPTFTPSSYKKHTQEDLEARQSNKKKIQKYILKENKS